MPPQIRNLLFGLALLIPVVIGTGPFNPGGGGGNPLGPPGAPSGFTPGSQTDSNGDAAFYDPSKNGPGPATSGAGAFAAIAGYRSQQGLPSGGFAPSGFLNQVAAAHNSDMIGFNFVGVTSSIGKTPAQQVNSPQLSQVQMLVFVGSTGTNMFSDVMTFWEQSPAGKNFLLTAGSPISVGINVAYAHGVNYVTVIYAMP